MCRAQHSPERETQNLRATDREAEKTEIGVLAPYISNLHALNSLKA